MMLTRRKSPAKRTTRTVGLLIGQWSFPWRTQRASKLERASLVELGAVVFTGRELQVGKITPVPEHNSLRLIEGLVVRLRQSGSQHKVCETELKGASETGIQSTVESMLHFLHSCLFCNAVCIILVYTQKCKFPIPYRGPDREHFIFLSI
jgi:hypothetical protein